MTVIKQESLYFTEGSSDKEYHAQIVETDGGHVVNFQFGRRGKPLTTGTKTTAPVALGAAEKIFDKLIGEKMKKGYSTGLAGVVFQNPVTAERDMGYRPQLLDPVSSELLQDIRDRDDWIWQEKLDGERRLVIRANGEVTGTNRNGLAIALPDHLVAEIQALPGGDFVLDGEALGDAYAPFDIISCDEDPEGKRPYSDRLDDLFARMGQSPQQHLLYVPTAFGGAAGAALESSVREAGGEGVVGKNANAPYTPGRGPDQVKSKFTESVTAEVHRVNDGRSVAICLTSPQGNMAPVGNVGVPSNHVIPAVGSFVEIEYLYAFPEGSLFQPVYKGMRSDKLESDCTNSLRMFNRREFESWADHQAKEPEVTDGPSF